MKSVLICDDSTVARKQIARSLPSNWDVDVHFATNGMEAIDIISRHQVDVLLLDLNMPVMDGYQTLESINKYKFGVQTVVCSGDIQPDALRRVEKLGALDFIKKPIDPNTLQETLSKLKVFNSSSPTPATKSETPRFHDNVEISYIDGIQEIVNVAIGKSASLLAQLLNVFIKMPIPTVNLMEVSELQMALADTADSQTQSAVCQGFTGHGLSGEALIMFSDSSYTDMAKLLKYDGEIDRTVELELIMEFASILNGSCIKNIAEQLNVHFSQTHPVVLGQHVQASDLIEASSTRWTKTLAIEMSFTVEDHDISCEMLLLFSEDSIDNLQKKLVYIMG